LSHFYLFGLGQIQFFVLDEAYIQKYWVLMLLVNYRVLAWFQRIVDNYVHGVNDILTENDDMSDFDNNELINGNMPITLPGSNFLPVESKLNTYIDFLGHTDFFDFHSFL
jgi:hypothetical protein